MLGRLARASRAVANGALAVPSALVRTVHTAAAAAVAPSAGSRLLTPRSGLLQSPGAVAASAGRRRLSLLRDEHMRAQTTAPTPSMDKPKVSIKFSLPDTPGALQEALAFFKRHNINMTRLETRPSKRSNDYDFFIDFLGQPDQPNVRALLAELQMAATSLSVLESKKVPWFPRRVKELDLVANKILDAGTDLESDHPGFMDPVYRARRAELSRNALEYKHGAPIPRIKYSPEEIATWGAVYERLLPLVIKHGCQEHVRLLPLLQENCGYSANNIPQLNDISDFLQSCTGFTIRPVAGLLSARNFLYGLAFRTFFSTQYLRHHSRPLYTPEPDLVHELMGHAPLFADQSFADFSQEIGLAAIGATDEQITRLARIYWYTVEFGLCFAEDGVTRKAYGAGLLSSFGELEYAMGLGKPKSEGGDGVPEVRPWDPFHAGDQDYPITTYQPVYYIAKSFQDAKVSVQQFSSSFARQYNVRYNPFTHSLDVDGNVDLVETAQGKA